jgi:hypothetical protein
MITAAQAAQIAALAPAPALAAGAVHTGAAGAPVIVGVTPGRTPLERAQAHHGLPPYRAQAITGHGHGGGHGGRRGGIAIFGQGWGGYYPQPVQVVQVMPDCHQLAAQAQAEWAKFGVTGVYCTGSSLVVTSPRPDTARRSIPPTWGGYPTIVQAPAK